MEGLNALIHICKYVNDAEEGSICDKDLNIILTFYTDFIDQFVKMRQDESLIELTQNLIQSTTTLFMKYGFDPRVGNNRHIMEVLVSAYNYCVEYYKDSSDYLRENIIFCFKKGYIPKLLYCLSVCSEVQNVLDTIKSFVHFRTTVPIFTDDEKILIFNMAKRWLLKLPPDLNYDFAIMLVKDFYVFLPSEVDGMPASEAADRVLIDALIAFWKNPFESAMEKNALKFFVYCFLRGGDDSLKWATPESVKKIMQESPISTSFFRGNHPIQ